MSSATWQNFFTYKKCTQITAQAIHQSLKETEHVAAEKMRCHCPTVPEVGEWCGWYTGVPEP
ncbi:hypothetical protein BKA82DRAFT_940180 [Pisolithus tinctorius]|uniref:Uncharacterized protein n=1 Tax=Pisolithus tinctorius Marx 270 TaxID=870435 RepID=A0A0C3PGZ6_PISTI|nr:hypothetical protein BKA82DRAFT_940180 [Pisolithus tinctorius]KIO07676.1 hypothetical protein M404DRAFT_940180 [Pisolithus tinctorius Marx 270]